MFQFTKARVGLLPALLAMNAVASAQSFVTPTTNTNIIGQTPNPANIRDLGLKQQQEPSCIIRPSNESYIFCAYNDLRAADLPNVQGDSWMGVSMSNDAGQTWFSRLAPGYKSHPNSLGMGFAADPGVVAIPSTTSGGAGFAVLNYIAGFRNSNTGVLAIQRWVERPVEDQDFWKAENKIYTIADGSEGRFIDKPAFLYIVDEPGQQGVINESVAVEGEGGPVSVRTPTGTLVVVYAVFTGNAGGAKLLMRKSYDNGRTWTSSSKISEEQNEVTGVSLTAVGQNFVAVYRRKGDTNEPDAVMTALCANDGNQKCSKGQAIFQICPFDQPASGSTFRTFSFPWAANDGNRFWAIAADRRYPDNSCTPVPGAPGLFSGKPRIVAMSSVDGKNWVGGTADKTQPIVLADRADGFQMMPVALGTKGRIDIAWYDTFREEDIGLPPGPNDVLVNDYVANDGLSRVFRKADIFMTRLKANCNGGPTQGCNPVVEQPVRVSNYKFAVDLADPTTGAEIEAHLPNLTLYGSGLLAFNGDYIALATPELRKLATGKWIPNSKPGGSNELPGFTNRQDLFIAWGDNRDVRADFPTPDSGVQLPYTPPLNSAAATAMLELEKDGDPAFERPGTLVAADEPDDDPVQPSDIIGVCGPGLDYSRSRDSNVYGSLVRDEPSLVAPTATKPLGTIQRMFPLILTNIDADNGKDFCLEIANQPLDYPSSAGAEGNGLASFFQLPSFAPFSRGDEVDLLDVFVPAGSSASRAVFVTTNSAQSVVTVNAFEGACPMPPAGGFGPLVNSVQISDGSLFDPVFCQENPNAPVCENVSASETHDISFAAPVLQTAVLQAPSFQTPSFQTPVLQTPVLQTPSFQTPSFQTPSFQTPSFQTPSFQTPSFQTPSFQTPVLQTPSFQTPSLQSNSFGDIATNNPEQVVYQDVTYPVSADANVTTTYSADIALSGLDPDETAVQLVAWTPNAYATTFDCYTQPTSDQQIIAYTDLDAPSLQSLTLPTAFSATNQNPYAGALSFFGQPGKDIAVTVRIWAVGKAKQDLEDLQAEYQACIDNGGGEECESLGVRQLISFGASAHSCQTGDAVINTQVPGSDDCLNNGNEKILEDKQPPTFNVDPNVTIEVEADLPNGALVDLEGTVTASDNGESVGVMCYEVAPDGTQTPLPELLDIGSYAILCEAGDSAGNLGSIELTVDVTDTVPPVLELTGDTSPTVEAGTPYVDPGYTASDLRGTTVITLIAVVTGSVDTSTLGVYTLTYSVTDTGGNTVEKTRAVTVSDTIAPTLSGVPADIAGIEATGNGGASVSWPAPTASDSFEGDLPVVCSPASGTTFAIGSTAVSCSASDSSGNTTSQSFLVTVVDSLPPVISAPTGDVIEEATGADGAVVTWSASAIDGADPLATVACVPASGSTFAIGTTSVVCTASDTSGNSSAASFNVIVQDTTAPALGPFDDVAAEATGPAGAVVSFGPFAGTDLVSGSVNAICTPASGTQFVLGATPVSCTATDAAGNAATAGFDVTVADTTPPVVTAANIDIEAFTAEVDLEINYTDGVSVVDLVDGAGTITPVCAVADPGPNATDDGTVLLVTAYGTWVASCTATDAAGNTSAATLFNISVGFPWDIAIAVPKGNIRAGSTVPLDWTYSQNGQTVDSGALAPSIDWFGPYDSGSCTTGNTSAGNGEDAGGSDFRYTNPTWQYSWQTPSLPGHYEVVISPPGAADADATKCVRLR